MSDLKKKVEKNSQTKKSETPASKKEEGSALRNQGENINNVKNSDEEYNKGGHLKNKKGTGKGFDGSNYYENEQPPIKEDVDEKPKKISKNTNKK
ncbi:MAG: hypothetical protein H0U95_19035 [Bacteroidetes bacterium]|nr:hypothetical protein [Bacteroidota bacterium]